MRGGEREIEEGVRSILQQTLQSHAYVIGLLSSFSVNEEDDSLFLLDHSL